MAVGSATSATAAADYVVKKGVVLFKGAKVGTVDKKGNYQLTDPAGRVHKGNVATLIRADVQRRLNGGQGPSGRVRIDAETYEVRGGRVFAEGRPVGTVTVTGDYKVNLPTGAASGNVKNTPGAVWLGRPEKGVSARIELGGHVFTAMDGVIFESGEDIGRLAADGRFRGVTLSGDHFEGSLHKLAQAVYLRRVS